MFNENYEQDRKDKHWLVDKGDICVDVGSCDGAWACDALDKGASFVYAFDADLEACDRLMKKVAGHPCRVIGIGLWSHVTELPIGGSGNILSFISYVNPTNTKYQVTSLDTYFSRELPPYIDFIKLDVEGAELEVVRGGKWFFQTYKPYIVIETHNDCMPLDELIKEIEDFGYNITSERLNPLQNVISGQYLLR